jgi:hypothetical protein
MQASPTFTIAIIGGFVAGSLGGVLFSPSGGSSEPSLLPTEAASPSGADEFEQRFLELGAENAAMKSSIEALRASVRGIEGRQPVAPPQGFEEGPRRTLRDIDPSVSFSAEEEARFGAYLDRVEQQKEDEREARRAEQRDERTERRMDRYATELGLDEYQRSEMSRVLTEQDKAMRDYWTTMRESGSFDRTSMRSDMESMRSATNEQLGQFLNTTQMESYSAMDQGGFGGFGRDRGGDRGGGGSRGGNGGGRGQGSGGGGGSGREEF